MTRLGRLALLVIANLAVLGLCEGIYRAVIYLKTPRPAVGDARFDVYGVGESTLIGEPFDPKISIPRMLEHMFDQRIAGQPINVMNLAVRGVPLYPQALAFERAVAVRSGDVPGVVLVVAGHNESIAPPGRDAETTPTIFRLVAEYSLIAQDALLALQERHFVQRDKTLEAYERYLRQVIEAAQRQGLLPIVATMVSNISRVEPNIAGPGSELTDVMQRGLALEDEHRFVEARDLYIASIRAAERPQALLFFRAGRCEEELGNFAAAREHYWTAVDNDTRSHFGRATRAQNDLVRRLGREYEIPIVDAVTIFERASPHGFPAPELFSDGHHPSIAGYVLFANGFADVLAQRFQTTIVHSLNDAAATVAALEFNARDACEANIVAGSWLIAASVDYPYPRDRMAVAATLFRDALGKGDDFSAWLGLGLAQAATRGGLRSSDRQIEKVCRYTHAMRLAPDEIPQVATRLAALGVDADVVDHIRATGQGASQ